VSSLSTLSAVFSSLACFFTVTELLAVKATQWFRYIYFHWDVQVTNFDMFWNRSSTEGNYESIYVPFTARIVFGQYVEDVSDALCLMLLEDFILGTVSQGPTSYNAFAHV